MEEQQPLKLYHDILLVIATKLWERFDNEKQNNPGLNLRDNTHFKNAIRQFSIYDIKAEYLEKEGIGPSWRCLNQIFCKLMESVKRGSKAFKLRAAAVEKAYERCIEKITNDYQNLNPERVRFSFEEIASKRPALQPVARVQRQPYILQAAPLKKKEEVDMDALMMQELLSRSREQRKQIKSTQTKPQAEPLLSRQN